MSINDNHARNLCESEPPNATKAAPPRPIPPDIKAVVFADETPTAGQHAATDWTLKDSDTLRQRYRGGTAAVSRKTSAMAELSAAKVQADRQAADLSAALDGFELGFAGLCEDHPALASLTTGVMPAMRAALKASLARAQHRVRTLEVAARGEVMRADAYLLETADAVLRSEAAALQERRGKILGKCNERAEILGVDALFATADERCRQLYSTNRIDEYRAAVAERDRLDGLRKTLPDARKSEKQDRRELATLDKQISEIRAAMLRPENMSWAVS